MIVRLRERPDDFVYGSMWRDLMEPTRHHTWAERVTLRKEWAKFRKNEGRREMLGRITKQILDPEVRDKWGFATVSQIQAFQQAHNARLKSFTDVRSILSENYK